MGRLQPLVDRGDSKRSTISEKVPFHRRVRDPGLGSD